MGGLGGGGLFLGLPPLPHRLALRQACIRLALCALQLGGLGSHGGCLGVHHLLHHLRLGLRHGLHVVHLLRHGGAQQVLLLLQHVGVALLCSQQDMRVHRRRLYRRCAHHRRR